MTKVLIVDDVEDNIELLGFELEEDGFEVISAVSGSECLDLMAREQPDIVLLDIQMPGIDGLETLQRLKNSEHTADIPVIMVSARTSNESVIQSLDLGAHDYVRKPIEYPILSARMRSALHLVEAQQKLERANEELERLATQDPLTNINNRRNFFKLADAEFAKAKRYQRPMTILMLDGDNFKKINDTYGHASGDEALLTIVSAVLAEARESDIFGRVGGEEFAVCCPDTPLDGATNLAERIRKRCESATLYSLKEDFSFSVSIGITNIDASDLNVHSALSRADTMLYEAKNRGRNQVVTADSIAKLAH